MRLKSMFPLLPDTPAIYPVWENLVIQYRVSGKPAHDARLVAAMQVHGLTAILTFDKTGFCRHLSSDCPLCIPGRRGSARGSTCIESGTSAARRRCAICSTGRRPDPE